MGLFYPYFVYLTNHCRNPVYLLVRNWHQSLLFIRKGTYHFQAITALSSIFCRILESIVKDKIMSNFNSNELFCDDQHGFRSKRSCETQLLTVMEHWTRCVDDENSIDVVYLDFLKAFDKVPHKRLLAKLEAYGIVEKYFIGLMLFFQIGDNE